MTQVNLFTHPIERHGTQAHLDENRERFSGQLQRLYDIFADGQRLTGLDAMAMGIMRLASRVNELRKSGVPIQSEWVKTGKTKSKIYYYERK